MDEFSYDHLFAERAADPRLLGESRRGKYDFAVAYPDPQSLPLSGLLSGLDQALREEGGDLSLYYYSPGYTPLREFVAEKLARDRNIHVTADDIVMGDGSGQPIHMLIETLVDPGDVVLTEDFIYGGTLGQLRRFQADIRGVACDGDGMRMDALEETIQQVRRENKPLKFIYTVPTFQNPQGWTMTLERRQQLVEVSKKYDVPILEDDCYVDCRIDGPNVTSIYSLDDSSRVMYVGSFSKIIAPGMRMGYLTAPRPVLERALGAKSGGAVNLFAAFAIHRFAVEQLYDHMEEINEIQRAKRDAMLGALDQHFNGAAKWSRPNGGLYIWLEMPTDVDLLGLRDTLLAKDDVGYLPGPGFAPDGVSGRNYARLCFGYNKPAEIEEGIAALANGLKREGAL